jgi:hypothetical protein
MTTTFGISGFFKVTSGNVLAMKTALVKYGPVSVAIYADNNWRLYSNGILYDYEW